MEVWWRGGGEMMVEMGCEGRLMWKAVAICWWCSCCCCCWCWSCWWWSGTTSWAIWWWWWWWGCGTDLWWWCSPLISSHVLDAGPSLAVEASPPIPTCKWTPHEQIRYHVYFFINHCLLITSLFSFYCFNLCMYVICLRVLSFWWVN